MTPPIDDQIDEIVRQYEIDLTDTLKLVLTDSLMIGQMAGSGIFRDRLLMAAIDMGIDIIVTAASLYARRTLLRRGEVIVIFQSQIGGAS